MSRRAIQAKMSKAQKATLDMDELLIPATRELQLAVQDGNGAAIYFSHSRVRSAMAVMADNLKKAADIYAATDWPTDNDYDRC